MRAMPTLHPSSLGWPLSTRVASKEREKLCDLLAELGSDAPTLCEGWTTAHMAAHLVARERRPDAGIGLAVSRLHAHTEHVEEQVRQSTPYDELVARIRSGPPLPLRPFNELINAAEYFVHHEDVRRPNGREPRPADPERDATLWRQLRLSARGMFRGAGAAVTLERLDGRQIVAHHGADPVVIRGSVDELTLLGFGRRDAARVEVEGSPSARAAYAASSFGL
jgi:uncharacterized protein (TIGR03085 family)